MEKQIKGGYILVSLGLIALSTSYSGNIDYDRISRTKKHIVLTGIKVADTVMPDITVKPIYGNGTITFADVYGFDIIVSSNNSVSVIEHESEIPNVEEAPSGTIVDALGLDEDGKVVKGAFPSAGLKLYMHHLKVSAEDNQGDPVEVNLNVITNSTESFVVQGGPPRPQSTGTIISANVPSEIGRIITYDKNALYNIHYASTGTTLSLISCTIVSQSYEEI